MATDELAAKLSRRNQINESEEGVDRPPVQQNVKQSIYAEFKEFSLKEIKDMKKVFQKYDVDRSTFLDFMELKLMMEKLGAPQTHLALKEMIKTVDEDHDGEISFREFMLIFRKAKAGELDMDSGLYELVSEIDVDVEGVKGAKDFFQAKIAEQTKNSKFEQEIIAEQMERKQSQEEAKVRKQAFMEKASMFQ